MRVKEKELFRTPYPATNMPKHERFADVIDARIVDVGKLSKEIRSDFDPINFGISWWQSLDPQRRILIGDYLYQCVLGIETNFVEARLHYYLWLHTKELIDARMADSVTIGPADKPLLKLPAATKPDDDLPTKLDGLHLTGFFRALGSALDCLGASIVGVLGFSKGLRRVTFNELDALLSNSENAQPPFVQIQMDFKTLFEKAKKDCGPEDWLNWATQYRNTLVHRGRLTWKSEVPQRKLIDLPGNTVRANHETHLDLFPDRSDIESWIRYENPVLAEDAHRTTAGLYDGTKKFAERILNELINVWQVRRKDPNLIKQPRDQWIGKSKKCNFGGYGGTGNAISYDQITTSGELIERLKAASLLPGSAREFWKGSEWLNDEY
jgi:hypothetical protein